jgi:starch-binding outer membrane protein, SusD/RagB family
MRINIKTILAGGLSVMVLMTSCFSELDPKPLGDRVKTSENVYDSPEAYLQGLAKLYATFAVSGQQGPSGQPDIEGIDEGFGNYLRQYWNAQELTTDEAVIGWNDATIKDFHWHTWTASDVFLAAVYSRIMYTVTLSNEYIRATAESTDADLMLYNAEARYIRALAYYHGLDLFGNMPFVTEADLPGAFFPEQTTRADLFAYIESELAAIEPLLGEPGFEYGRADQAALWMLQGKLYLNAEVYIGTPRYTETVTAMKKIIDSGVYSLSNEYRHNFVADNHTSPEVIFAINFDSQSTQTYGGMVYLIHAPIGGTMKAYETFGTGGPWGGIRTTSAFVEKFEDTSGETDSRALFHTDGQTLEIVDIGQFTHGYAVTKFRNRTLADQIVANYHGDFVNTDYVMFRLADAYLMYAEAVLRGGSGGTTAEALTLVNDIRERAYGNTNGNLASTAELTLDFIIDERSRELYWEGHRRTDLIRFGLFTGGAYLWPWKGKVAEGTATESFRNLFPIPSDDRAANPTLEQNDGYN